MLHLFISLYIVFPYHTRINNPTSDPLTLYPKTKNLDNTTAARNMNICFEFSIHLTVSPLCPCILPRPLLAHVHPCTYLNPVPPLYPCMHFGVYSLHPCTYLGLLFAHECNLQCTELSPLFNPSHTSNPLRPVSIPQPPHPPIHISAQS